MNPIMVVVLFLLLYQENNNFPNHFETFKLERLLDKLNFAVSSLDKINHLNEIAHEPLQRENIAHTIQDSLHTVKPLLPNEKSQQHLDTIESVIDSIQKIGGIQNMAQSLGPALKMLSTFSSSSLTGDYETEDYDNNDYDENDYDDNDYHENNYESLNYNNENYEENNYEPPYDDPYDISKFK